MPKVGDKHYPYTKAGYAAAAKARAGYKEGGRKGKRVTKAKGGRRGR